jgi:ferredoxin
VVTVRIEADRERCIGAGMCVMTAEQVFDQDDEGVVVVLTPEVPHGDAAVAARAVASCPAGALRIVEG